MFRVSIGDLKRFISKAWRSTVLFAAFGTFLRIGANLILIPLVTRWLSPAEQALWWVFVALGNFASLADFGLGQAIARVYSFLWAGAADFSAQGLGPPSKNTKPNMEKIRTLSFTVRRLFGFLSVGAVVLLGIAGTFILQTPIGNVSNPQQVWLYWGIYLLAIGYNFWAVHWLFGAQGTNRIREMQTAYIWSSISFLIVASTLLLARQGLLAMVCAALVRGLILSVFARKIFRKVVPLEKGYSSKPDFSMLSRLWPNAWKFGVLSLGAYFLANGGVLISSHFLGPQITASVGLTTQVTIFIVNFAALWLSVKWPQITILRTQGKFQEMSVLFARRLTFVMASYLVLATSLVFLGNPMLEWKGSLTRLLPMPYLVVYLCYMGVQTFYVQFGMLAFTENVVPFFKISLYTGLGMMVLSLIMTPMLGLWGLLLAPIIAEWACSGWFTIRRGFQGQNLSVEQFLQVALLKKV